MVQAEMRRRAVQKVKAHKVCTTTKTKSCPKPKPAGALGVAIVKKEKGGSRGALRRALLLHTACELEPYPCNLSAGPGVHLLAGSCGVLAPSIEQYDDFSVMPCPPRSRLLAFQCAALPARQHARSRSGVRFESHRTLLPRAVKKPTTHPTPKKPTTTPAAAVTQPGVPQTGPAGSTPGTVAPVPSDPTPTPVPASPTPAPVMPAPALQPTVS